MISLVAAPLAVARQTVTWVKVEKPSLDLVGILLSSLGVTVTLILLALAVGGLIGLLRVRHARSLPVVPSSLDRVSLHLDSRA